MDGNGVMRTEKIPDGKLGELVEAVKGGRDVEEIL